jgi:GT2 family glycosyltransferase
VTGEPTVAIVLLNYNGRDLLETYLPSVLALDYDSCRVVVVDNDSSDGSVPFLREEFPEVTVVENDRNLGFARGNNVGASAAGDADYLWFLNTDTKVEPSSLSTLVEHVEAMPETGIAVPRIDYMDDPGTIQSLGYDYSFSGVPRPRDHGREEPSMPEPHAVTYGSGAALLVDGDVWDELGGFDDDNFIFGDDVELCLRAWMRGHRVEVVPDSVVSHELGASRERIAPTVAYHNGRSRTRTLLKLFERRTLMLGLPGFVWYALRQMVADAVLRRSPKAALYRLGGYLSPLPRLPALYRERRRVQRGRVRNDAAFLPRTS